MVAFLLQAILVSLSGVMAPGPITAATLAAGVRRPNAGAMMALGHGIVEFPLMALLVLVLSVQAIFQSPTFQIGVGLAGGGALIILAMMMAPAIFRPIQLEQPAGAANPVWTGVILSGGNPYFLLWWATAGLVLLRNARQFGPWVVLLFAIVHWTCDLVWLLVLSQASFRGSRVFGARGQRFILALCAVSMFTFGILFAWWAVRDWVK